MEDEKIYKSVSISKEQLDAAYKLVQEHVPEFKDVLLKDIEIDQIMASFKSLILVFGCEIRKVVYKHEFDDFVSKYLTSDGLAETLKALKNSNDPKYSKILIFSDMKQGIFIENFIDGKVPMKETMSNEEQIAFHQLIAKEIAVFQNAAQGAYDQS